MRALLWFVGSLLLAALIGAVVAYPVYVWTSTFSHFAFHRVAGRITELVLALELFWLCRHLKLGTKRDFGFGLARRQFLTQLMIWIVIGVATAGVGAFFLIATGLRVSDPSVDLTFRALIRLLFVGLTSGLTVALIEETVFRGALHTAIESKSGPWAAALATAPLFAILHFYAKTRIPAADLHWASGFDLLVRSFAPLGHPWAVMDAFASWLVVGLVLSLTRILTGNIAVAMGLHAGWVIVLRVLADRTVPGSAPRYAAWVGQFDGLLGYWLIPWGMAIGWALWRARALWVPYASGPSTSNR